MDEALSSWWHADGTQNHKAVPFITSWALWIAINELIFNNKHSSPSEIASKAAGIIAFFIDSSPSQCMRIVVQKHINKEVPWGYFDGAVGGIRLDVVGEWLFSSMIKISIISKLALAMAQIILQNLWLCNCF